MITSRDARVHLNIKNKLEKLYKEKKFLNNKEIVWQKTTNGLSIREQIQKNEIEIKILEEMLQ